MRRIFTFTCVILGLWGCNQKPSPTQHVDTEIILPKITDERSDLVLSWYVDGGPETGSSVSEVPDKVKSEVRVQDPSIPPEKRDPEVVYLADLTKKSPNGTYSVKAIKRSDFEAEREAERQKAAKAKADAMAALAGPSGTPPGMPSGPPPSLNIPPGSKPPVIMYATKHCPVCVKARRWLLEKNIPYIEKDLEQDQAAAMEVQKKGQAQGVSTNGVPIFEIYGRLLPGFDPARIVALLAQGTGPSKTI